MTHIEPCPFCGGAAKGENTITEACVRCVQCRAIDWKALSHAVRVGREALELLSTGNITFPLPYRERVLAIKKAELSYHEVAEEIEGLLTQVEAAAETSPLPDTPDMEWVEAFVCDVYSREFLTSIRSEAIEVCAKWFDAEAERNASESGSITF